jgi:hypothetical protein
MARGLVDDGGRKVEIAVGLGCITQSSQPDY